MAALVVYLLRVSVRSSTTRLLASPAGSRRWRSPPALRLAVGTGDIDEAGRLSRVVVLIWCGCWGWLSRASRCR
jgi:hypothetical protein